MNCSRDRKQWHACVDRWRLANEDGRARTLGSTVVVEGGGWSWRGAEAGASG